MHETAPQDSAKRERIQHLDLTRRDTRVEVCVSRFRGASGVDEYHLALRPRQAAGVEQQLRWLVHAYRQTLAALGLAPRGALLRRFFCTDIRNQTSALAACPLSSRNAPDDSCAISWIEQPPAPPSQVTLWAYHVHIPAGDPDKTLEDATLAWRHKDLTHYWTTNLDYQQPVDPGSQTRGVLECYDRLLRARGLSLADNVVRTWLFVRDIDNNYAGMVAARRDFFREHGLTSETHFIASTGIEGGAAAPAAIVTFDAYAVDGLKPQQITYLAAPQYLSPTHVYGVTFERGVAVAYRDRSHVFISGTASIDHRGEVLHHGDIARQLDRTLINIDVLLKQAAADFGDVSVLIAYVRNPADRDFVEQRLRARHGAVPLMVVAAPVCRPDWLVEIECQATVPAEDSSLPAY